MAAKYQGGRRVKPESGFELWAWYWMRISGLLLVILALGHLFVMHILNNVEVVNYSFVVDRWTAPGSGYVWRIWDLLMINLAVLHGANGVRQVLYEYVIRPGWRVFTRTVIWTSAAFLIVLGTYAILMFEPNRQYLEDRAMEMRQAASSPAPPPPPSPPRSRDKPPGDPASAFPPPGQGTATSLADSPDELSPL